MKEEIYYNIDENPLNEETIIQDNVKEVMCGDCEHYGTDSCILTNSKEWITSLLQVADCRELHLIQ